MNSDIKEMMMAPSSDAQPGQHLMPVTEHAYLSLDVTIVKANLNRLDQFEERLNKELLEDETANERKNEENDKLKRANLEAQQSNGSSSSESANLEHQGSQN